MNDFADDLWILSNMKGPTPFLRTGAIYLGTNFAAVT